jgi:hypothetical protein
VVLIDGLFGQALGYHAASGEGNRMRSGGFPVSDFRFPGSNVYPPFTVVAEQLTESFTHA